jgi:hypothetical protein
MKHGDKIAPVAGALGAIGTLLCCLPLGFAGAAATAGLAAAIAPLRAWMLGASVILLSIGAIQLTRDRRCATKPRTSSVVVLCVSAAIITLVVVFPQVLAGILADWLPWGRR